MGTGQIATRFFAAISAAALISLSSPASAEPSIVERERARRATQAVNAQQELARGDKAYQAGDYKEAVSAYAAARGMLSPGPLTAELRKAVTERFAQASVERARQLAKIGSREDAHALLDTVLAPDVLPGHAGASQLKGQIDDPLRYNPALTPDHVVDVDKVRRLLYEAHSFAGLGRYGQAQAFFESVLRIDPTNSAARRGIEAASARRSDYFEAAKDETRATMFAQVDQGWELAVPPSLDPADLTTGLETDLGPGGPSIEEKLRSIIIPIVNLDDVTINEAFDFMRQVSIDHDHLELDAEQRGISFVLDLGTGEDEITKQILATRFDLKLRSVPLGKVLEYINSATSTTARVDQHAITIRAAGSTSNEMQTKNFRVPPDFLKTAALNDGGIGGADDPFPAAGGGNQTRLKPRLTPKEFLKQQGVSFPEGSSVILYPGTGTLVVTNTRVNLDYVEQIVDTIAEEVPVVVVVDVRFIRVRQTLLEELGYDWITSGVRLGGHTFLNGGTTGNGSVVDDFGGLTFDAGTSGLRSGEGTQGVDTVDSLLDAASGEDVGVTPRRAPGILSLVGTFDSGQVGVLLRGLEQSKSEDWMVKKSVVTRSGQKALIESVQEMIYPTEYEPPEIVSSSTSLVDVATGDAATASQTMATPAHPTDFETTKLGCILEVEPLVGPNKQYVEVSLQPVLKTFDGFIDYGSAINGSNSDFTINGAGIGVAGVNTFNQSGNFGLLTDNEILMPIFSTTRTNSTLTIADGQTVVMGGMLKEDHYKYKDKLPILGDLPFLGRFFRSESETSERKALVIMVTVKLVDPGGRPFHDR